MSELPVDPLLEAWTTYVSTDQTLFTALTRRHRERHRRHHTIEHLAAVVEWTLDLSEREDVRDIGTVVAAAMYHDAVYEPSSPANERASARLARRDLASMGWEPNRVDDVAAMIEATSTHLEPIDVDTGVLFDADLSILGADPGTYAWYVAAVRSEYRHVDDDGWTTGRSAVLHDFLGRPQIYATGDGRRRWEAAARSNLESELAELSGRSSGAGGAPESG